MIRDDFFNYLLVGLFILIFGFMILFFLTREDIYSLLFVSLFALAVTLLFVWIAIDKFQEKYKEREEEIKIDEAAAARRKRIINFLNGGNNFQDLKIVKPRRRRRN